MQYKDLSRWQKGIHCIKELIYLFTTFEQFSSLVQSYCEPKINSSLHIIIHEKWVESPCICIEINCKGGIYSSFVRDYLLVGLQLLSRNV